MDKSALRRKFKDIRASLPRFERDSAALQLRENLKRFLRDYVGAQTCLYQARPEEAPCDLKPIEAFFYPVLKGEEMEFRQPVDASAFHEGAYGISEPIIKKSKALNDQTKTVVCCPAVAVDINGNRLGLGKGYYDRYFMSHPHALRVGVVFHVQCSSDPLPADSRDQKLDWIVSEKMILRTSTRSS